MFDFPPGYAIETAERSKIVRCYQLSAVFDAPAKSLFLNTIQFNGNYGCSYCLEKGETYKISEKGHTHIYPSNFESRSRFSNMRTHKETLKFANEAQQKTLKTGNKIAVFGVKGDSWALHLPKFDVVNGVGIDYLHNTLLGVTKMLIQLWFDKTHKKQPWYTGKSVKAINDKIQNLRHQISSVEFQEV